MRRVVKISAACIASAALALSATACGSTSSEKEKDSGSGGGVKIGLAFDVGGRGDHSFNDSAARGADKAKDEFDGELKELTAKTSDTEADRVQKLTDLADAGYNPVIGVGFAYAPSVNKVAAKYPDTTFGIVDSVVDQKNVNSVVFTEEQGSYLAGVAAALKTKKKHVGFIGGNDNPLIKKFEAGYVQGIKDTDPKIEIERQYLSRGNDTSGFTSPDKGKSAAEGMLDKGADVVYSAAGNSNSGAIEAAAEVKGAWAIGTDSDPYEVPALSKFKHAILSSMLKNVDLGVYELVKSVKDGKPKTGISSYALKDKGVQLSTSGGYLDDIKGKLDEVEKKIVAGDIKVKTTP
ncbi:BMP family ABC transporter substrate-binding protein [Streptomyces sp. NA04227]|uniref:BMP family lipoprotein n=1 Tax=Streptomyces sp. NA04227 TaxID=2742136 RepID=UPI0015903B97|nr:BMP family ABC transporter substrate-binding protein [Streptomyces sp. NA04227]QKW08787.1 BMP family ABC transporter substrate-binding protein [Streptomyces sp. NA04227]